MESKEFTKTLSGKNNGFLHILINLILLVGFTYSIVKIAGMDCMLNNGDVDNPTIWILLPILLSIILLFLYIMHLVGFMTIQPNESRVLTFFGKYSGTAKQNGFFWVNPFYKKEKLSLRARNMDVEPIKVNDKNGNPIMIGLVLVWKIRDTYKACFDIDSDVTPVTTINLNSTDTTTTLKTRRSFDNFVRVQSDAALRKVAGLYADESASPVINTGTLYQ